MLKTHKETKVEFGPSAAGTVVSISVPSSAENAPQRRSRISVRSSVGSEPIPRDEDAFAQRYLATQSSIYFRRRKTYPRSFLWRVIRDNRVLELRSVDLTKSTNEAHEAGLTIRLEFQGAIIPGGVALSDPEDHEALNVFVISSARELYTFTLRPEFFRRSASIDETIADWCKISRPAPFNFAFPHRIHASSPLELFISLDSGALLRLTRKAGEDGSHWFPIIFDEKPWGASIRGLVRWNAHQPIKYGGRTLDPHTPNAITTTSDGAFAFVVSLDHSLKVWNLSNQSLAASKDLLNRTAKQQEAHRSMLNPAESSFIRIINAERLAEGNAYYVVTYSPHEDGQFKFWRAKGGLTTPLVLEDLFPNSTLKPADPDSSGAVFWTVIDFQIKPADEGRGMALWVLWRSNTLYQLYSLHFDMHSLEASWDTNWTSTAFEVRRDAPPPDFVQADVVDPTEKWLEYIFCPGRFTTEVLETSLAMYQDAVRQKQTYELRDKSDSLKQRVCSTVVESTPLRKLSDAQMDFLRYSREIDARWRQFWQVTEDLSKRRNEALSLAYDTYSDFPWLILTDGAALIRECSGTELILHNEGRRLSEGRTIMENFWPHRNLTMELRDQPSELCSLIAVAAAFRQGLAGELRQACRTAFNSELFAEPSLPAPERLAAFYARCGFVDLMTDEVFDNTYSNLDHVIGFKKFRNELFFAILETFPLGFPGKDSDLVSTVVGRTATVQGAMEMIWLSKVILEDLILLAVFVETEVAVDERRKFDGVEVFAALIDLLREYEMINWLCSNVHASTHGFRPQGAADTSVVKGTKDSKETYVCTILEDLFAVHIKPRPTIDVPQMAVTTQQIRDVISWITRQGEVSLPNILVFIQCNLLASNNIDLASDFLRFQPNTAWSTYVKGRLYVAKSDFDVAAIFFQKAAYVLSYGKAVGNLHEMSSNLLDLISVNYFYNGLPKYFQHIITVFEHARAFAHVADFAHLALQSLECSPEMDGEYNSVRTDLMSRLFHASLKTCRFDEAFSAFLQLPDSALQKSAVTSLITTILTASGPGNAGLRRILHFPLSVNGSLCFRVDAVLESLAKKQLSATSSLGQAIPVSGWQDPANIPNYNRILQAFRIARNDFRGAAEVAYRRVSHIRDTRDRSHASGKQSVTALDADEEDDLESKELRHELLALINLLACMEKNEAYIVVEQTQQSARRASSGNRRDSSAGQGDTAIDGLAPADALHADPSLGDSLQSRRGSTGPFSQSRPDERALKRVIITLEDLRREYQAELDRVSRIARGDWEFGVVAAPDDSDGEDIMNPENGVGHDGDVVMGNQ